jgi:hypothetical protein
LGLAERAAAEFDPCRTLGRSACGDTVAEGAQLIQTHFREWGSAVQTFEITEHDLLWILCTIVATSALISAYLWIEIDNKWPFDRIIRTLLPYFAIAVFVVSACIHSIHAHQNRELLRDIVAAQTAMLAVVYATYKMNKPRRRDDNSPQVE